MKTQIATIRASLVTAALLTFSASALAIPTLWGIDEDDGRIFSIGDYTNASSTYTDYGKVKYRKSNGSLKSIGNDIEAFTINRNTGDAYFVVNDRLKSTDAFGTIDEPVLLKLNIDNLVNTGDREATVVGRINVNPWTSGDNITGVDFDANGNLWALLREDGSAGSHAYYDIDKFLRVDTSNANVLESKIIYGYPANGDESDNPNPYDNYNNLELVTDGEDFVFDENGGLFITDDDDEEIYQGNINSSQIINNVYDAQSGGGISGSQRLEALAWDFENDRLIAFDDKQNVFALITAGDGGNSSYGGVSGLTDVEGLAFYDVDDHSIPTPGSALLLGLGLLNLGWLRRRRMQATRD